MRFPEITLSDKMKNILTTLSIVGLFVVVFGGVLVLDYTMHQTPDVPNYSGNYITVSAMRVYDGSTIKIEIHDLNITEAYYLTIETKRFDFANITSQTLFYCINDLNNDQQITIQLYRLQDQILETVNIEVMEVSL